MDLLDLCRELFRDPRDPMDSRDPREDRGVRDPLRDVLRLGFDDLVCLLSQSLCL